MQSLSPILVKIFSAPWVLAMDRPALAEGAVAVRGERIVAVGERREIRQRFSQASEERCRTVLMPGLVNGHCHLELSYLRDLSPLPPGSPFTAWIEQMLKRRAENLANREERAAAAIVTLQAMGREGTILVADIGNELVPELRRCGESATEVLSMLELLAPTREAVTASLATLAALDEAQSVVAHAPYSTAAEVLQAVKARCRRLNQVFSVHCAESREECEFVGSGGGDFAVFLQKKRGEDLALTFADQGYSGVATYFHALGLLDSQTLLVHGVHLSEEELALVATSGSHLCLCPGSNRFLGVGRAPLAAMLEAGILPALGTDSLASNASLDLWREMALLAEDHPRVKPERILGMATLGGALALQRGADYGSLAPGCTARMLEVDSPALARCVESQALFRELVNGGCPPHRRWVGSGGANDGK